MPDQVQDTTVKTATGKVNLDHNLIFADIAAQVITIHTEAAQGHNTGINTATTGAAHNAHAPPIKVTVINPTMTHHINHIADHPHFEVFQLTNLKITAYHAHNLPTNFQGRTYTDQVHVPADHEANHTSEGT